MRSLLALAVVALPSLLVARAEGETRARPAPRPVLVELYSSEGCSSCPSADRLLAKLARTQPIPGVRIVPLELHVDYWDDLGWADPFAQAAFTERQRRYAEGRDGGRVYTPALVVAGGVDLVGSNEAGARAAILAAAKPTAGPELAAKVVRVDATMIEVAVTVGARKAPVDVLVALTQANLATDVARGENAGQRLAHAPIVRALRGAGAVAAGARAETRTIVLPRPRGAKLDDLRVVAFAQAPRQGAISAIADVSVSVSIR